MKIFRILLMVIFMAALCHCSKKNGASDEIEPNQSAEISEQEGEQARSLEERERDDETEKQPDLVDIGEDCIAFLRLTTAGSRTAGDPNCSTCPPQEPPVEVLSFRNFKINGISCSGETCEVQATISGMFNKSNGGEIRGGLVGWITPEQRRQYASGETPSGEHAYAIKITYHRDGSLWKPVEFEKGGG
jgi:hypothetical protein